MQAKDASDESRVPEITQEQLDELFSPGGSEGATDAVTDFVVGAFKITTSLLGASWGEETLGQTVEGVVELPHNVAQTYRDWDKLSDYEKEYRLTTLVLGAVSAGEGGTALVRGGVRIGKVLRGAGDVGEIPVPQVMPAETGVEPPSADPAPAGTTANTAEPPPAETANTAEPPAGAANTAEPPAGAATGALGAVGPAQLAASIDQILMQLRDEAVETTRKVVADDQARGIATTPAQFGSLVDAIFKAGVKASQEEGILPQRLQITPSSLNQPGIYGIDVWDPQTGTGWDLTTATERQVIGHDARYLFQAMSDGTILQDVIPLVYSMW